MHYVTLSSPKNLSPSEDNTMNINNMSHLNKNFIDSCINGTTTHLLGLAAGSQKLYVNIDYIPPKSFSAKYHSHSQQEEFFLILDGCGTLRINDEEHHIQKGDFIAKPPGQNIAHTFYNSGIETLSVLDVGTKEKEDTCFYPDEDIYLHKSNGVNKVYAGADLVSDWTSEPGASRKTDSV